MSTPPERLPNKEGQRVPDTNFRVQRDGQWVDITSEEIFRGRNVVVFSLPGAFTPTCSTTHLPRYNELAPVFRRLGIDGVVCVSVNDPFVMEEWGKNQEADQVMLLPDGNGAFTAAMGLMVDKSDLNFGNRSWRYSMLVRDGRIEKMFLEPPEPGDPLKVSDADTMLHYLDPKARAPDQVAVLSREGCPFCAEAKTMLQDAGVEFVDLPLPNTVRSRAVGAIAGAATVPQVFFNGRRVGGTEELRAFLERRDPDRTPPAG
jgi:peroxiredoxin